MTAAAYIVLGFYVAMVIWMFSTKPADIPWTWRVCLGICCWPWLLARAMLREHRAR